MLIKIRNAEKEDLIAIHKIFNEVLLTSTATFEEMPYTLENWIEVFEQKKSMDLPFTVAEVDGKVIGYGTMGPFRKASGYKITYEHSLHIEKNHRSQGVGNLILAELIAQAQKLGLMNLVGAVDADNISSIAIHKKFGFKEVGRMPNVAKKFGRNLTLVLLQKELR